MPLQNPTRTSTYTSSTSASTTPTQSVYSSLYMTTSTEQKELALPYFNRLSLSFSSSSDEASMVPSKSETDSSHNSMMLPMHAAPTPVLPERGRAHQGKPIVLDSSGSVTPPPSLPSQDPHFQYLSSSESASSPGGSSPQSESSSRSPSPAGSFLFLGVSRAIPAPALASNKTDDILGESTPAIAKPMNIIRYGKPRVISIASSGRSSTCTSRSQRSTSPASDQAMRTTFIASNSSQTQSIRSEYSGQQSQSAKLSDSQHFARKHVRKASESIQYPELRPLASLGEAHVSSGRASASRSRAVTVGRSRPSPQPTQQRNLYPITLPAISSLSTLHNPRNPLHPQPYHNQQRPQGRRFSLSMSSQMSQPSSQSTPGPSDHHSRPFQHPPSTSSSWAKKIGIGRSPAVSKGQRSRGAGIRPAHLGEIQRSQSTTPWDPPSSTSDLEVIESLEPDLQEPWDYESQSRSRAGSSLMKRGPSSIGLVRRASIFGGSSSSESESNFGW